MSFSNRILVGLASGVLVGLFLGEHVASLKWAADGFVKLLQMTVLPYVTVSIVGNLGRLQLSEARSLGIKTGAVIVGLWALSLVFTFLIPFAFPEVQNASFFSTTLVERRPPFNFIDLYIPSNPFHSLANNVVPAVVLFSVLLGIALIGVERKQVLLDVLDVAGNALARATRFIVSLTPYGLFAIAATAAGTLSLEQIERLQVYLIVYVLVALLVSLWVLPGLVAALTPIRIPDIFRLTRDGLVMAFVAGDLFIVLPVLIDASKTLLTDLQADASAQAMPDVIVPASFNFPHAGKLLSISFILFAGWFADAMVSVRDYPQLAVTGLISFFGSLNVAVPFLLDLFRIPADTFQLFLASGVVNSRFGTLVAAMHTLTVALLGSCAMAGLIRWNRRALVRYAVVTVVLTITVIGGTRALFASVAGRAYTKDQVLSGMHLLQESGQAVVLETMPTPPAKDDRTPRLDAIRSRGTLFVGFLPDSLPYAFLNARNELVGFDIEMAYKLAGELGVRLELAPIERQQLDQAVADGAVDLVMSGVAVTTPRASTTLLSNAYLDETFAFIVPDAARESFMSWDAIRERTNLTVGVPNLRYYIDKLKAMAPRAQIKPLDDFTAVFRSQMPDVDALAFPAERGSAWTLMYPAFSVVVPEPNAMKVPLAYPIARNDQAFATFINTWIDLKRKDGTVDALYRYWILGQIQTDHAPRWSIIRNVLHWVE